MKAVIQIQELIDMLNYYKQERTTISIKEIKELIITNKFLTKKQK